MKYSLLFLLLFVTQLDLPAQCAASFTLDDTEDVTVQFFDASTVDPGDQIVSWFWDFDDGGTSTQQNPLHTFPEVDKFDVELEITTANGCTSDVKIRIEICGFQVTQSVGSCDANGNIPVTLNIIDIHDNADEIDIIVDGQNIPGGPFEIEQGMPVNVTFDIPGDGLDHPLRIQSTDIATCTYIDTLTVPDCNSNCFLSGLQLSYTPSGVTHNIQVGDDFFAPGTISMDLGDDVLFTWTGDGHSTTSDSTSGEDSWNSGVISLGSTFIVDITHPGTHPYYCLPHGAPGGVGMSGEILANCGGGNMISYEVQFNTSVADPQGYNMFVDGNPLPGNPYQYNGTGAQSETVMLPGDGATHTLEIIDINDPTCVLSRDYNSPDCGQGGGGPTCSLTATQGSVSAYDGNDQVSVEVTVAVQNGGNSFDVTVDNGTPQNFPYNGQSTTVSVLVNGDGNQHTIMVEDADSTGCSDMFSITTVDCNIPCNITNLTATPPSSGGVPSGVFHEVEVRDFDFSPQNISISEGDQVKWVWTGAVDHTTTSDATSGSDSWDSGLLGTGATYESPVLSQGSHPYYCIPHGSPGGVGMAGTVTILPPCNGNNEVLVNVSFDIVGAGAQGYEIEVDGTSAGTFSYTGGSTQTATVNVIGDGQSHQIAVIDVEDNTCMASTSVTTPDCGGGQQCDISVASSVGTICDGNDEVDIELTVTATGQGNNFTVELDGSQVGTFSYTGGTTQVSIKASGDGQNHTVVVTDDVDPACTSSDMFTTVDCSVPCVIDQLAVSFSQPTTHTVLVEDFKFTPKDLEINKGDTVLFRWTGQVPHTATSDVTSGMDAFDSGLLSNGAEYKVVLSEVKTHGYYCKPHGAPGGIGMAGTIIVNPNCDGQIANGTFSYHFDGASGNGFDLYIDGSLDPRSPINPSVTSGNHSVTFQVLGDGNTHTISIEDSGNNDCENDNSFSSPDCGSGACNMDLSVINIEDCIDDFVTVNLYINSSEANRSYSISSGGVILASSVTDGNGNDMASVELLANGGQIILTAFFDTDTTCKDNIEIQLPECTDPCLIENLNLTTSATVHYVDVLDFTYAPLDLEVLLYDTIVFVWKGEIPHTVTSDASSGPKSFDSGLLGMGES